MASLCPSWAQVPGRRRGSPGPPHHPPDGLSSPEDPESRRSSTFRLRLVASAAPAAGGPSHRPCTADPAPGPGLRGPRGYLQRVGHGAALQGLAIPGRVYQHEGHRGGDSGHQHGLNHLEAGPVDVPVAKQGGRPEWAPAHGNRGQTGCKLGGWPEWEPAHGNGGQTGCKLGGRPEWAPAHGNGGQWPRP